MVFISMALTAWLGSMFVYSAGLKLAHYDRAGSFTKPYRILPPYVNTAVGLLLPWAELSAGMLLLVGLLFPVGQLLGAALGVSFAYASFRVLHRGADVPCGCTGSAEDRVNRTTLIRAIFITAFSLLLSTNLLEPAHLPLLLVIPIVLVSLLPAGLHIRRRIRVAQWHKQREQYLQGELERARRVLTAGSGVPC